MPEDKANIILTELRGFRELVEIQFKQNQAEHKAVNEHLIKLNGQTQKNSDHRIAQCTTNKWTRVMVLSVALPLAFLVVKSFL